MKAVCLLSGGMDSATLAYYLRHRGYSLTLLAADYGQRHRRELRAATSLAKEMQLPLHLMELQWLGPLIADSALVNKLIPVPHGHYAAPSMLATVVPNRNVIFLALAYGVASGQKADAVAIATHAGDHYIYPDCRPTFLEAFVEMEGRALQDLHLPALMVPFSFFTKADIVAEGTCLGVPYHLTYSCYTGEEIHCGACGTCVERQEAFQLARVPDPTEYQARVSIGLVGGGDGV